MSSKFTNSQPTIEVKVNSPTANVGITDAEYNILLNPDVETDIFATKTELSAVENKIPAEYVKSAAVADNKLTLTKQDNTVVEFEGGGGSYTLPVASTTTLGGVKVDGTSITIADGVISTDLPTKTSDLTNDSGFITNEYHDITKQDKLVAGDNITIEDNVISSTGGGSYTLPVASNSTLGGVKIGRDVYLKGGRYIALDGKNQIYIPFPNRGDQLPGVILPSSHFGLEGRFLTLLPTRKLFDGSYFLGGVKPDGTTITADEDGTIYVAKATTTTIGGVKPDGTTITIDNKGVITANIPTKTSDLTNDSDFITTEYHDSTKQNVLIPGDNITITSDYVISATQPTRYIESASATENTLKLYYNDNTFITFTPTGGSGGGSGGVSGYAFSSNQSLTDNDKTHLKEVYNNKNIHMTINNLTVVRIMSLGSKWGFVVVNTNGATSNQVLVYTVNIDSSGNITSNAFALFMSYYLVGNSSALSGDIITSENWSQYISAGGGGDWNTTTDVSYSDLYNAKELMIIFDENAGAKSFFHGYFPDGLGNNTSDYFLTPTSYGVSSGYLQYNGSSIEVYNTSSSISTIYYKT